MGSVVSELENCELLILGPLFGHPPGQIREAPIRGPSVCSTATGGKERLSSHLRAKELKVTSSKKTKEKL